MILSLLTTSKTATGYEEHYYNCQVLALSKIYIELYSYTMINHHQDITVEKEIGLIVSSSCLAFLYNVYLCLNLARRTTSTVKCRKNSTMFNLHRTNDDTNKVELLHQLMNILGLPSLKDFLKDGENLSKQQEHEQDTDEKSSRSIILNYLQKNIPVTVHRICLQWVDYYGSSWDIDVDMLRAR